MATHPVRNIDDAEPGQVKATPKSTQRRLAIRALKLTGVKGGRRK